MRRVKFNQKRIKVSEYSGNPYSLDEKKHNQKYNIWMPEDSMMTFENGKPKTYTQFEREIKALHPNLYMVNNKRPSPPEAPYGHAIRIIDLRYKEGFDMVTAVGRSGEYIIPPNSQIQHFKDPATKENRSRVVCIGWSEAYKQVCLYLIRNKLAKKDN